MTTRSRTQEEGFDMANRWKASGMTAEQFAHAEGVTHHTVRYWAGRLRRHQASQPEQNPIQLIEPILTDLKVWLDLQAQRVLPSSLLGKAIGYTLVQWEKLCRYVDVAEITPDNNACENAIRPFVLGRKNWLFSGSPTGAHASCAIYTLIETAKVNGLKPWDYLHTLMEKLPVTPESEYQPLLPFAHYRLF